MDKNISNFVSEPFHEYLKKDFISASDIKKARISPKHYLFYKKDKEEQLKEARELTIGSAIHCLILEKDKFLSQYACLKDSMLPEVNKLGQRTYQMAKNREYRDVTFPELHKDKTILTEFEWDLVERVCESASKHPTVQKLSKSGIAEMSMYVKDEKTGLMKKGRADWLPDNSSAIIDYKSCVDSSPRWFSKDLFAFGYHNQAAWYCDLFDRKDFIFFAMEKLQPFTVEAYILDQKVLNVARDENRMLLDIIWFCKKTDFYATHTQFATLKQIYKDQMLYDKDKDTVYNALCQIFEINTLLNTIELPNWMP